jgi:hypothetical protein
MKPFHLPLVVCALATIAFPYAAAAQELTSGQQPTQPVNPPADPQPESVRRPYRGLFGPPGDPTKQSLNLKASLFGAYDDDLLGGDTNDILTPAAYQQQGWYEGATAGLSYNRPGDRLALGADADVAVNHYPSLGQTNPMYRGAVNLSGRLAQHTRANFAGDFVYSPLYRLGLFASPLSLSADADPFATVATDYDLFRLQAYRTGAQAGLTQSIGHASIEAYYNTDRVNYLHYDSDYSSWTAGARFSMSLTRHLGYHLGYGYSTANYFLIGNGPRRAIHNIDVGADYSRALSISRRTSFAFSTGSAILTGDTQFLANGGRKAYFRFTGDANLRHEMGRTWSAGLAYRRSVDWRETFNQPLLSDSLTASLGGLVSRRVRFSSDANYTIGTVGFVGSNNGYNSASASVGLEYALTHRFEWFTRFVYYHYRFDSGVLLNSLLAPALDRQSVRFGLNVSLPLAR